jgi:hypothetical protein
MTTAILTTQQRHVTYGWHRYSLIHPSGNIETFTARSDKAARAIACAFLHDAAYVDCPVEFTPYPIYVRGDAAA